MADQRAVQYDQTGGPEVLRLADVPVPTPGEGRALLEVRAVGINPYDAKVLSGRVPGTTPFPRGIGSDVAGVVTAVGPDATYADGTPVTVGDTVFGWGMNTLRERLVVRTSSVAPVPAGLPLSIAGALATPGLAAAACWDAVPVSAEDVVLVSPASGTVGFLLSQWAVRAGAQVIGTTSRANSERVRDAGITPVAYGPGLAERVTAAAGRPLTAVFDSVGRETLDAAAELGVPPQRVVTLADDDVAAEFGVRTTAAATRSTARLVEVAATIASGEVMFPVAAVFGLDRVAEAFALLETGHPGGKIVVAPAGS
ncbi:NADP-dependent oxidoreductase [Microbacterium gorillae]|uniref:NADP-dependent oxidoreductase n=1 Tax=Microbacterium gorillae TaxID=1231063 RepID=UPI00058C0F7B|nr:NADP-dependent oxidoreductase [Microbacterium gorillae]